MAEGAMETMAGAAPDDTPPAVGDTGRPPAAPRTIAMQVVGIIGKVLIGAGVLVLLFTAYQIWGTSLQESHAQSQLRTTLQHETNNQEIRRALAEAAALDKLPTGPPVTAPATTAPAEGTPIGDIRIPKIGINQVVVEGTNTPDLRKGPGHYIGTPMPGQAGNAAIAGHRTTYGHPFYNLDSVAKGDRIVVTTLQGIFVYDTIRSFVVSPNDTTVIKNVFADWVTLTTCNPRFSASTRLIVEAKLAHSQLFPNSGLPTAAANAPQSGDLAGDSSVQLTDALLWGFLILSLGAGILYAAYRLRRQRVVIYVAGSAGILVMLWFFFGAVSPLLPASF